MGIAIAILEEVRKSGAIFLVTTHYPEIKECADKAQDIKLQSGFDEPNLRNKMVFEEIKINEEYLL